MSGNMTIKENKSIVWVTPNHFIDVDLQIVPYLAKTFKIHWIVLGKENKPTAYVNIETICKRIQSLTTEYYTINGKWYMPYQFFKYRKFFKYVISLPSNIIYIDSALTFWIYYAAAYTLPKEKVILATHNVKTPKGARLEHFVRFFMKKTLNNFYNFHVFSKNQEKYLKNTIQGKNILYAPLTLKDYGEKKPRTENPEITNFLSFGHIRRYKRIDLLINAAQKLHEEVEIPFKITIAGNCTSWEKYQKLIKYPQLFDLKIGFINDDEVSDLFSNADFLVLPYQDLAQSGAITVAFNYHIPVITSDIIQFREFVENGKNGFLFKSEDINDLKCSMYKALMLKKNNKYNTLVESTKQFVQKNYTLSSIAEKYTNYFNKF